MSESLPNDADGDALRRLIAHGSNLTQPMLIDFAVAVPDANIGYLVAEKVAEIGFKPEISHNDETDHWSCYCSKLMLPKYDDIIAIQNQLDALSRPIGGKSDGWGSFGNSVLES